MSDKMTVVSKDGKWKVDMNAWKNYAFVYASIGSQATVYHMQETQNIWGNSTTDWVEHTATIAIENTYSGSEGSGFGTFGQSQTFHASHGELKLWAIGIISISINPDTGDTSGSPGGATLDISSVKATITVFIDGVEPLRGDVSADSIVTDNSIWG